MTLQAALDLVAGGVPVFPCRADKRPATPHGFKDAIDDAAQVPELWRRHPGPLIGVPTGAASGFDVLDLDPLHGAAGWWKANARRIPDTRVHRTRSGGAHILFRHAEPVRNTASKLGAGVDTRGEGGYVIWWPAAGCRVTDAPLAEWPRWLLRKLTERPKQPLAPVGAETPLLDGETAHRIALRVLSRLADAPDGQKHFALRKAAYTLGGLLDQLPFGRIEAAERLTRAVQQAGAADMANAAKTIAWGLDKGIGSPLKPRENRP